MHLQYWRAWFGNRYHAVHGEDGANLVEYILLIAFIAIIVIVAVKVLGQTVSTQYSSTNSNLQ